MNDQHLYCIMHYEDESVDENLLQGMGRLVQALLSFAKLRMWRIMVVDKRDKVGTNHSQAPKLSKHKVCYASPSEK